MRPEFGAVHGTLVNLTFCHQQSACTEYWEGMQHITNSFDIKDNKHDMQYCGNCKQASALRWMWYCESIRAC